MSNATQQLKSDSDKSPVHCMCIKNKATPTADYSSAARQSEPKGSIFSINSPVRRTIDKKIKVRALDIALLRESPPQKRSGMARVLKGSHSFTGTPTRSSAIGMSHTCLCLPSYSWYSFTDPGGMAS